MKCFYHHDIDAIGVCKKCQKGLCASCATDLGHGLACAGKHEEDVEAIEQLVSRNVKAIGMQKKSTLVSNMMALIMGGIFLGFGLYRHYDFLTVMGAAFILYWAYLAFYNSRVYKKLDDKKTNEE